METWCHSCRDRWVWLRGFRGEGGSHAAEAPRPPQRSEAEWTGGGGQAAPSPEGGDRHGRRGRKPLHNTAAGRGGAQRSGAPVPLYERSECNAAKPLHLMSRAERGPCVASEVLRATGRVGQMPPTGAARGVTGSVRWKV